MCAALTESLLLSGRRQQHAHLTVHLANMQSRPHSSMLFVTELGVGCDRQLTCCMFWTALSCVVATRLSSRWKMGMSMSRLEIPVPLGFHA